MATMSGPSDTSAKTSLRDRASQAIEHQLAKTITVLSSLLAAQDTLGYIPQEAIDAVAQKCGASANEVWGVASFYPNFRFVEPARHMVEVCWGPTCHIVGAQPLLQGVMSQLGLDREGDTADGAVTLKLNTCLGVCPHGPAMSFDHQLAGHATLEEAARRIGLMKVGDRAVRRERALESEALRERAAIQARVTAKNIERQAAAGTEEIALSDRIDLEVDAMRRALQAETAAPVVQAPADRPPAKKQTKKSAKSAHAAKKQTKKASTAKKKPTAKKKAAAKPAKRASRAKKS